MTWSETVASLLLLCFASRLSPCAAQIANGGIPACEGVFDLYFVLDCSGSVSDAFSTEIVPFVQNVTDTFISPNLRISFVTFSNNAVVVLNLTRTGDKIAISQGIDRLKEVQPAGSTNLAPGLFQVNTAISAMGGDTASVVLILTDGILVDPINATEEAEVARTKGASVFAIGVGKARTVQLLNIVDDRENFFNGSNFEDLPTILETVINKTCVEITSVNPGSVCIQSTGDVVLTGRGFITSFFPNNSKCRFLTDRISYLTPISQPVENNRIVCGAPAFNNTGKVLLQVTLNGISFISSNVILQVNTCQTNGGLIAGVVASLLALLALTGLCLLWFLFPLCARYRIKGGLPPEPREEDPKPTPPRKWETVDASYYGRGGVGGIKPVTVRWGESGATEEGAKLVKAKDAKVLEVREIPGSLPHQRHTPTCRDLVKKRIKRWYAVAASYRPVRSETKGCICCPGPHYDASRYNVMQSHHRSVSGNSLRAESGTDNIHQSLQSHTIPEAASGPDLQRTVVKAPSSAGAPARLSPRTAKTGTLGHSPSKKVSTSRPSPKTALTGPSGRPPSRTASAGGPGCYAAVTSHPPSRTASTGAPSRPPPPRPTTGNLPSL